MRKGVRGRGAQQKLKVFEYSSNNSGGSWWLSDKDWKALEDGGWEVQWGGLYFCNSKYNFENRKRPAYLKTECPDERNACHGHRRFRSYNDVRRAGDEGRWLGALATHAKKSFEDDVAAIEDFERLTGQNVEDQGCNCCGSPHYISEVRA